MRTTMTGQKWIAIPIALMLCSIALHADESVTTAAAVDDTLPTETAVTEGQLQTSASAALMRYQRLQNLNPQLGEKWQDRLSKLLEKYKNTPPATPSKPSETEASATGESDAGNKPESKLPLEATGTDETAPDTTNVAVQEVNVTTTSHQLTLEERLAMVEEILISQQKRVVLLEEKLSQLQTRLSNPVVTAVNQGE